MANIKAVFHKKNENGTYDDVDLYTSSDIVSFDPTDSPLISTYVEGAIKELAGMTSDSIFGVLSSDSQNIPTDANGNNGIYTNAVTTMKIYNGNTDDTLNWIISATPSTSITGTLNGSTYSVTNMTEDTGYVDMIATRIGYPTITKRFSLSKSKQGANSIFYTLNLSTLVINKNELGEYTPPTITATLFKTIGAELPIEYSGRFIIAETTDGINYTNMYTSSANETSKTYTPTSNVESIRIRGYLADDFGTKIVENQVVIVTDGATGLDGATLYTWIKYADTPTTGMSDDPTGKLYIGIASNKTTVTESSVYADYTWSLIKGTDGIDGVNAIIGILNNEATTIPTDASGNNGVFTNAISTMKVYNGATDDTANWTFTASALTGVTGTLTSNTYTVTAMTVDSGYVDITATRSGYSNVIKRFTLTKNKQGITGTTGTSATAYWLVLSNNAIQKSIGGVYTPSTITASLKSATGSSAPISYSGRFIIADTTDGTTFVDRYTSSANESSHVYTPLAGIKALRVRGYLAGGTTTLLDEEQVVIVTDGATGSNGINAISGYLTADSITLPADYNGAVLSFSTATGTFKVFNGTTDVTTSSAFSKVSETGCTSTINATTGLYSVTAMSVDYATAIYQAVYGGVTIQKILALGKSRQGAQGIIVSSTAPTSPVLNQLWQDTSAIPNLVKKWNGTAWVLNYFYAENIVADTLSVITANLGEVTAGKLRNATSTFILDLANGTIQSGSADSLFNVKFGDGTVTYTGQDPWTDHVSIINTCYNTLYQNLYTNKSLELKYEDDNLTFTGKSGTTVTREVHLSDITTGNCKIMSGYITVSGTGVNYTQVFTLAQVRTIFGVGTEKTTNNFTASLMNGNEGVNNHKVYAPSWNQSTSVLWAGFDKVLASGAPLQINYILTMT